MPSGHTGEARQTDSCSLNPSPNCGGRRNTKTETEHMVSAFSPHSLLHHPEHLASMSPTLPSLQIILRNKQEVILQTFTVCFKCHANRRGVTEGLETVVMHQGAVLEGKAVCVLSSFQCYRRRRLSAVLIAGLCCFLSTHFSGQRILLKSKTVYHSFFHSYINKRSLNWIKQPLCSIQIRNEAVVKDKEQFLYLEFKNSRRQLERNLG